MMVKTSERKSHTVDLEDILELVMNYKMNLNFPKCSFGVITCKFLGFMLPKIGR